MSVDRFIISHLKSIESNAKLVRSSLIWDFLMEQNNEIYQLSSSDNTRIPTESNNKHIHAPIDDDLIIYCIYDSD